jgi:hypothetical protein
MTTREIQHPTLRLIACNRETLERRLLHLACCGSNEEHDEAARRFLHRADLHVVSVDRNDLHEPHCDAGVDVS